jgi:hypothetical protein
MCNKHFESFIRITTIAIICILISSYGYCADPNNVNTKEIAVSIIPDKTTFMLGEPVYISFTVYNYSDHDVQVETGGDSRNKLGRPESFTVMVVDEHGLPIAQPDADPNFGGLGGREEIPAKGNYTFRLFLPQWATFEKAGNYSITAKRDLMLNKCMPDKQHTSYATTKMQVEAAVKIRVLPYDNETMGHIIDDIGNKLFVEDWQKAEEAAQTLSCINDERVIHILSGLLKQTLTLTL